MPGPGGARPKFFEEPEEFREGKNQKKIETVCSSKTLFTKVVLGDKFFLVNSESKNSTPSRFYEKSPLLGPKRGGGSGYTVGFFPGTSRFFFAIWGARV